MNFVVQKFGGSSVATPEKLRRVASKIVATKRRGKHVVVVVSAMGKTTDQLVDLAKQVSHQPDPRELDLLLASGEQISSSLLAMAIQDLGESAVALTGSQSGIATDGSFGNAEIVNVETERIRQEAEQGRVVVVAGFQGSDTDSQSELTTLGRGGSDTSAVALAGALGLDSCDIFTDVDGVYSADPRIIPQARRIEEISYEQMRAFALYGARVLHIESIEQARRHGVAVRVCSTFGDGPGTWVRPEEQIERAEDEAVTGVATRKNLLGISSVAESERDRVFERLLEAAGSEHDIFLRPEAANEDAGRQAFSLLVSSENLVDPLHLASELASEIPHLEVTPDLGSVSAIGQDLDSRHDLRSHIEGSLAQSPLDCFTTRESLSCLVQAPHLESTARHLHENLIEASRPSPSGAAA